MDPAKADAFAQRLTAELNGALNLLNAYLGHRLGLFAALADHGPLTSFELATHSRCSERYVREWLECLSANEYLDHDPLTQRFSMPPELAALLLDADHPNYSMSAARYLPGLVGVLPALVDVFRTGGGVPFEAYGAEFRDSVAASNRPLFVNQLAGWMQALPDVGTRLRAGGRVVDFGCGLGASTLALARAFPSAHIDGVDVDTGSIDAARRSAATAGLADRVRFHLATPAGDSLTGPYDLVAAFECLHDAADPVHVLRRMRELAAPQGAVLVADERVADDLAASRRLPDRLLYGFSVLHCLPQAMTAADSAATGAILRTETLRGYARAAGFAAVEVLPIDNPVWRFYRLRL